MQKQIVKLTADGASRDNSNKKKRRASIGYLIEQNGERIVEQNEYLGQGEEFTNNLAEYRAIIHGIREIKRRRPADETEVQIRSDSELVVNQLIGEYNADKMQKEYEACLEELRPLASWSIEHVSEGENKRISRADDLAEKAFKRR